MFNEESDATNTTEIGFGELQTSHVWTLLYGINMFLKICPLMPTFLLISSNCWKV